MQNYIKMNETYFYIVLLIVFSYISARYCYYKNSITYLQDKLNPTTVELVTSKPVISNRYVTINID